MESCCLTVCLLVEVSSSELEREAVDVVASSVLDVQLLVMTVSSSSFCPSWDKVQLLIRVGVG